jgi:hypothetical protein
LIWHIAQLVIKCTEATPVLVINGDTEYDCPISVHPLARIQTLIVVVSCYPLEVLSRGRMLSVFHLFKYSSNLIEKHKNNT